MTLQQIARAHVYSVEDSVKNTSKAAKNTA